MSAIQELPINNVSAGLSFNYDLWTAGTTVTLCNVPWNSDYRDLVKFSTNAALDAYLFTNSGPVINIDKLTYARAGVPVRINVPFNAAYRFNYLRVSNPAQPINGDTARSFYYFIGDVTYIAPNTTQLLLQLDVWQTFNRDVTFGNCYVERGHIGIANQNAFANHGRDYLAIPEGLDVGGEYNTVEQYSQLLGDSDPSATMSYDILMTTTVSLEGSGGTITAPELATAKGSQFEFLPNGAEIYYFANLTQFTNFMAKLSDYPWVSQGIISIIAVPHMSSGSVELELISSVGGYGIQRLKNFKIKNKVINLRSGWRDSISYSIPARYRGLKKFLTYPYTVVELTTYSGTPLILKPESMGGDDLNIVQLTHLAPPNPRVAFYPYKYNTTMTYERTRSDGELINDMGEYLDMMTGIFNFPSFSVVNNSYMQFLASNANTLAYQHSSADWSQQRALTSNTLGFEQASAGIGLTGQLNQVNMQSMQASTSLANDTAAMNAVVSGGTALASGAAGGPAGLAAGALSVAGTAASTAIATNQRNQQLAIDQQRMRAGTSLQQGNASYMRDTNKGFADFAAQGDYQNAIGGINARVQDARLTQPTTSGQVGGDAFNLATVNWSVHAKVKQLQMAAMRSIGEYWLRYGYQVNTFTVPPATMQVMTKFTYWKLKETYIRSSFCPEAYRQTIRGIFEKGVTVWSDPNDIGMIDIANNQPLAGVSL